MPTTSRTTILNSVGKAWSVIASTAFLVAVALLIFPWPNFSSFYKAMEPPRRIELPCKPPLSLLCWWNLDRVAAETDGGWSEEAASQNVEYWHKGERIAKRSELGGTCIQPGLPWVAWRGSYAPGEIQVYYGTDDSVTAEQVERWQQWVRECEAPNKVVFAPRSLIAPGE